MKRTILPIVAALLAGITSPSLHAAPDQWVYIGTYTKAKGAKVPSEGVYLFSLDSETGKLTAKGLVAEGTNPSFLAVSPSKKNLYAVSEAGGAGALSAYALDRKTGKLSPLGTQSTPGQGFCHVAIDATGKVAMAASYGGGQVVSLPIKEDGALGETATFIQHEGPSGANAKRQEKPHAHSVHVDKGNKFAFACDLGCDKIFIYKMDTATAKLVPNDPAFGTVPAGGGPRHFAFHPNGKFAWTNNEMTCSVTGFVYDATKGELKTLDTISTLPPGVAVDPAFSTAEIIVHPNGKFLYVSNRGHDTIACYSVDSETGKLTYLENAPALVEVPRNFGIDPTGKWLITAGQKSSSLAVFSIDQATGKLKPTGQTVDVGSPVCVKFVPVE